MVEVVVVVVNLQGWMGEKRHAGRLASWYIYIFFDISICSYVYFYMVR